jgi:hypothetical protein
MEKFTIEDLYISYEDCIKNKKSSRDYLEYELKYKKTDLLKLLDEINTKTYKVWNSYSFIAYKPKIREIFAAGFRDRIVHHLLVWNLEEYFEKRFYKNIFSCRKEKWALLGIKTLFRDLGKVDDTNYFLQLDLKWFLKITKNEQIYSILNSNNSIWEIVREIYKIFDFKQDCKIPIYNKNKIDEIKEKYYKNTLSKPKKTEKVSENQLSINIENNIVVKNNITTQFVDNFTKTDFKNMTYYEIVEYIIHWKKLLTGVEFKK